jgi:hypothetical protein
MEVRAQLHTPAALPTGKEPLIRIGQEAGWGPRKSHNYLGEIESTSPENIDIKERNKQNN